jgi:hypothetical protein
MSGKARGTKRKATQEAGTKGRAPSPDQAFVIQCSRESEVVEIDEETFVDRYNEEVNEAEEEVNDAATAGDGVWLYNHKVSRKGSAGAYTGQALVFKTREAANSYADTVWHECWKAHPFDRVYKDGEQSEDEDKEADEGEEEEDDAGFKVTKPDGGVKWQRQQQYTVDPWGDTLNNIVKSTLTVEVVSAKMMS